MSSSGFVSSGLVALANAVQAGALQLTANASFRQFSTCTTTNNSCLLPLLPSNGQTCKVRNDGATSLNVFPQVTGTINALAINAQYIVPLVLLLNSSQMVR